MPEQLEAPEGLPPRRIIETARELGLDTDAILPYGHYIAKIPVGELEARRDRPDRAARLRAALRRGAPGKRRRRGRRTDRHGGALSPRSRHRLRAHAATILGMQHGVGLPKTVLAEAGFASAEAVAALEAQQIEPLVAIGRTQPHRRCDVRPPPDPKPPRRVSEPWRLKMQAKLETEDARKLYSRRQQTVEPVFGIIKAAIGFTRFRLRGLANAAAEWTPITLAYNCRRLHHLQLA